MFMSLLKTNFKGQGQLGKVVLGSTNLIPGHFNFPELNVCKIDYFMDRMTISDKQNNRHFDVFSYSYDIFLYV